VSRVVYGASLDVASELSELVAAEQPGMVRDGVVLMSRLLASGLIPAANAAQGLRDLAHDMRITAPSWVSVAARTALLERAAQIIDSAESARRAA
jgi:hypothetical protein